MAETQQRSVGFYPLQAQPSQLEFNQPVQPAAPQTMASQSSAAQIDHPRQSPSYPLQARPSRLFQPTPTQQAPHQEPAPSMRPESGDSIARNNSATSASRASHEVSTYPLQARPSRILRGEIQSPQPVKSVLDTTQPIQAASDSRGLSHAYPAQTSPPSQGLYRDYGPHTTLPKVSSPVEQSETLISTGAGIKSSNMPGAYPMQAPLPFESQQTRPVARAPGPHIPRSIPENTTVSSGQDARKPPELRHRYPFYASSSAPPEGPALDYPATKETEFTTPFPPVSSPPRLPRMIRALKDSKNGKMEGRTIVICLDGTGDKFDSDNSNIVHLVSCLKKSDPSQITYYQSGIGTYDGGGLSNGFNAALDMAIGSGLGVHIRDAYHFLMQNYLENDRICLFGFSRGAYTARCLAGMVHKVGLLPAHNTQQIPFAYQYYKDDTKPGWKMSEEFKKTFCMDVSVHFIGCFDSVASVGFIPRTLPLSSTPYNKATYFRHALALDERRAKFKAKLFERKDSLDEDWETAADVHEKAIEGGATQGLSDSVKAKVDILEMADDGLSIEADPYLKHKREQAMATETDVLEVWFAGCHADVGGGAVENERRHKLAQIPLRWMLRQCFECNTGIIFKIHRLADEGIDVHTLWPTYTALPIPQMKPSLSMQEKHKEGKIAPISRRSTVLKPVDENDPQSLHEVALWKDPHQREMHEHWVPEQVEDYFDSISEMHDQLIEARAWWILEFWPVAVRVQVNLGSDEWAKKLTANLGRYRAVTESSPNLHWTVQQRIEALGYKLNVRLDRYAEWNVVA